MKNLILILGLCISFSLFAQEEGVYTFTLEEAIDFALKNNSTVKNAELDVLKSQKKIWETTAMGLPHADATISYQYSLNVPALFEVFSSFGTDSTSAPMNSNDLKSSIPFDLTVSQLVFSGPYIVGLQASKVYSELADYSMQKSKINVKKNVINTYFLALVTHENKIIIDSLCVSTKKSLSDIQKMFDNGFVDEIDLDQMKLTYQTLKNTQMTITRQSDLILDLLKYQIGLEFEKKLVLKDSLNQILDIKSVEKELLTDFNIDNNMDYKLLLTQEKLMKLDWRRHKTEYLPSISAFYTHHEQFNDKSIDFQAPDMIGLSATIPIFSSGQRMAVVSQSKLEYEKSKNTRMMQETGLKIQFKQAKVSLLNAYENYNTEKDNFALSKKIYSNTLFKYKQGMASSFDLTQVQNQYLNVQSSYYNAITELISKQLDIKEIINNL